MAAVLVLAVATPAVATEPADIAVSVGNTSYTVEVTHNGTAVNDTAVRVEPTDPANATYAGDAGTTDVNGTVTFDLPENETKVNISTTFNGTESSITYVLPATSEASWDGVGPFGKWVSRIVHNLIGSDLDSPLGQVLSELVTANNPGSEHRSDKANPGGNGPPDHAKGDKSGDSSTEDADEKGGPPDHAKDDGSDDDSHGNATTTESTDDDGDDDEAKGNGGNHGNGNNGKAKGKDK